MGNQTVGKRKRFQATGNESYPYPPRKMSENGIPIEWVRLMKETIKSTAAGFSARRMVKQYIEKFYSSSIRKALEV